MCINCGDNIFKCFSCHNINYDKYESLICTECGNCKYGKIDIMLSVQLGFGTQKIEEENDKIKMQKMLSDTLNFVMKSHESLKNHKNNLISMIRSSTIKVGKKATRLIDMHNVYSNSCVPEYKKLIKLLRNVNSIKSELIQYSSKYSIAMDLSKLEPSNGCYGCSETFLQIFLKFIEVSAFIPTCCDIYKESSIHLMLFNSIIPCSSPSVAKLLIKAISSLSVNDIVFTDVILNRLKSSVDIIRNDTEKTRTISHEEIILNMELVIRTH